MADTDPKPEPSSRRNWGDIFGCVLALALIAVLFFTFLTIGHGVTEMRQEEAARAAAVDAANAADASLVADLLGEHDLTASAVSCWHSRCEAVIAGRSYKLTVLGDGDQRSAAFPGDAATPPGF